MYFVWPMVACVMFESTFKNQESTCKTLDFRLLLKNQKAERWWVEVLCLEMVPFTTSPCCPTDPLSPGIYLCCLWSPDISAPWVCVFSAWRTEEAVDAQRRGESSPWA